MASDAEKGETEGTRQQDHHPHADLPSNSTRWAKFFRRDSDKGKEKAAHVSSDEEDAGKPRPEKWSMGILNDKFTDEVPGSILLMSSAFKRNEPLGLRNTPARTSASSLPSPYVTEGPSVPRSARPLTPRFPGQVKPPSSARSPRPSLRRMFSAHSEKSVEEMKRTADGAIILEPQPEDSLNDPLNWPAWRRDVALLSLGFYCAMGGGMTTVLAAAFNDVSHTYGVSVPEVALTTGFYMCGMGLGSVIASPTAILFGKRPVYMVGAILFIISSCWCAASPSYPSLVVARIVMGFSISPVECLPSATIAEIFYLHERAYRLGVYTLLLLGGKNLIPLFSAAIDNSLGWRWIFWIVALTAGVCLFLLFFFVPETFWDRTPRPEKKVRRHRLGSFSHLFRDAHHGNSRKHTQSARNLPEQSQLPSGGINLTDVDTTGTIAQRRQRAVHHVGFADAPDDVVASPAPLTAPLPQTEAGDTSTDVPETENGSIPVSANSEIAADNTLGDFSKAKKGPDEGDISNEVIAEEEMAAVDEEDAKKQKARFAGDAESEGPITPQVQVSADGEHYVPKDTPAAGDAGPSADEHNLPYFMSRNDAQVREVMGTMDDAVTPGVEHTSGTSTPTGSSHHHHTYTQQLRHAPPKSYVETLKPWNGRLRRDNWFKVAVRPFILFAYPNILWSTLVYSLSVGWLIVISESVSQIFRNPKSYNFTALQTGLVYLAPFIGGILGTVVAGKVSDLIVRFLSRRNNGIYEPEFRLVMGFPILLATALGLMGFGWSAAERDNYMVPTVFFGIVSFGCTLGSTTAITFAVDSYRQYAGEALVTLNFSKNIFHGLVFSLFFPNWLEDDGPKNVFITIGGIQVVCLLSTIPLYIYGKRSRMWTVRKNMMERL